jgi:hypothetical protein
MRTDSPLVAAMFNLAGPDLLVIFLVLLLTAAPVIGIVALVYYLGRRNSPPRPPPLQHVRPAAERLAELDRLKEQSLLSEAEYGEQRRKIISGI